jgi:hypothetical protein
VRSLNHCHHKAHTRDDNKVSGQRICATAHSCTRLRFTRSWRRSESFTSTVCFVYFELIFQASTNPKGEFMITLVAMGWFHLVFVLVLLNIHKICLKLKSRLRIIHKFTTWVTLHSIWYIYGYLFIIFNSRQRVCSQHQHTTSYYFVDINISPTSLSRS